ncbi:hypothetical protein KDM41_12360 [bacterium]|nr:hypothetical protein [bacterium]
MPLVNAFPRRRALPVGPAGFGLLLVVGLLVVGSAHPAVARIVKERDGEVVAPRAVFGRLAAAWEDGDEETLAGLVHGDGLRVTAGPSGGRVNHYSPSQAYYYFRNVFRAHRTLLFEFEMMQDATAGERVHGMATWKRRRPDSEHVEVLKLVCTLVREDDAWKLAEINTIR